MKNEKNDNIENDINIFHNSQDEVNEKIMKEIKENSENIEIPDSLSPDKMMEKIKASGIKKNKVNKRTEIAKRISLVAACILCVIGMGIFGKEFVDDKKNSSDKNLLETGLNNPGDLTQYQVLELGEAQKDVIPVKSRDDIIKYFSDKYNQAYSNYKKEQFMDYSSIKGNAFAENSIQDETGIMTDTTENYGQGEMNSDGQAFQAEEQYYENNDQVKGVVESDVVLTDGKNIYSLSDNTEQIIITAADKGNMSIMSTINIDDELNKLLDNYDIYDSQMYVYGDKLIIVSTVSVYDESNDNSEDEYYNDYSNYDVAYGFNNMSLTYVMEYDISDVSNPKFVNKAEIDGYFSSARLVDGYLYIISKKTYNVYSCIMNEMNRTAVEKDLNERCIPKVNGEEVPCDSIYYCGGDEESDEFEILVGISVEDNLKVIDTRVAMAGYGIVYASKNNIYTLSSYYEKNGNEEYDVTRVIKYSYEKGMINPTATVKLQGYMINQFCIDEYDGYLRMITEVNKYVNENEYVDVDNEEMINDIAVYTPANNSTESAVYVLDDRLNVVGTLNGLGSGENIQSARFDGNIAYFVTFLRTDPLFAIDLSEPDNPKLISELKVTGFSTYLHKWSDTELLGVGNEADDNGSVTGVKLSMFDVNSKTDISEINREVISSAYIDNWKMGYKDFLVDEKKNIIGLALGQEKNENGYYSYDEYYMVYRYENNSFINSIVYQNEEVDKNDTPYYRGLYIGDYLYIVTMDYGIQTVNLSDMSMGQYISFR